MRSQRSGRMACRTSARALVLGLALFGAGSKAGLVPLHVWLPLAHPAAPSHVSALMSGVMTKVAIYGFLRIVFDLLGQEAEWWWGIPILAAGGGTAVLGILYALMQDDLKRGLAYSTIENIGVIFAGLGLALAFDANGWSAAGALALTAALFHVLNHALFKSLLFFGAGAVLTATGERQMDRLGGLIHRLPVTSFAVLVACAAALRAAATQWICLRMAALSSHPAQPFAAALGPETSHSRDRRAACPGGGARSGLFRAYLRDCVSWGGRARQARNAPPRSTAGRKARCSPWPPSASSPGFCRAS